MIVDSTLTGIVAPTGKSLLIQCCTAVPLVWSVHGWVFLSCGFVMSHIGHLETIG